MSNPKVEVAYLRKLLESWARAVRRKDIEKVVAHHSKDILMFDVEL